ncbi:hypothetical protein ACUY2X_08195 [Corynebacterium minutissimum]
MNSFALPTALADILAGRTPSQEDLARLLQLVLTALVLGGTLVAAVVSLTSPSQGGSSNDKPAPEPAPASCDYELPVVHVQRQLETIQHELIEALNTWREEDNQGPLVPWIDRQTAAREKAECNAVTKTEKPADENIQMVQHHLPLDQASAYEFVEAFRQSPSHVAALRDRRMSTAAVGTAYNDGQVYVVIQLEE